MPMPMPPAGGPPMMPPAGGPPQGGGPQGNGLPPQLLELLLQVSLQVLGRPPSSPADVQRVLQVLMQQQGGGGGAAGPAPDQAALQQVVMGGRMGGPR